MARLLFLTSRLPWPPREGHQLRSWHVLSALAEQHEVTLLSFRRADDAAPEGEWTRMLAGLETFPIPAEASPVAFAGALARGVATGRPFVAAKYASAALQRRLAVLAEDADLVHFDMLPLMANAHVVPEGIPVTLNAHNVEHRLLAQRARQVPGALARAFLHGQLPKLEAFEAAACRRADLVLACSATDAAELRALAPSAEIHVVPNGVDLATNRPEAAPPGAEIAFVGQMGWFPNRDGVEWFLDEIFPRVLARRPDARFVLVGKPGDLEVPAAVASQVRVAGFVPDVRPLLHAAAVYVVPLRAGSGTRLKVLEAMALGKAIVTTTVGSEGIDLSDGDSARFADDAGSFADAVVDLLDDPDTAARLGAAARAVAERHYGWDAIGRDLRDLYAGALAHHSSAAFLAA